MQQSLFESLPTPSTPDRHAAQRWWRLQGAARRAGRRVEPLLVTPRFVDRIHSAQCPVTRAPLGPRSAVTVPLRDDAAVAAGHLVTLSPAAAAAAADGGTWSQAWAVADNLADGMTNPQGAQVHGLDAAAWRRLAVLRSFVQPLSPAQAAGLPLLVLPPNRLRVLSPVQGLQVVVTLALQGPDRARRLLQLARLGPDEDTRMALRVFVLTLLARCPAYTETLAGPAGRLALEDLWLDALLQRRWQRLASRLTDADALDLLARARHQRLLGTGWRPLEPGFAVDGWDLPASPGPALKSGHARRQALASTTGCASAVAPRRVASAVLGAGAGRHGADADPEAAAGH